MDGAITQTKHFCIDQFETTNGKVTQGILEQTEHARKRQKRASCATADLQGYEDWDPNAEVGKRADAYGEIYSTKGNLLKADEKKQKRRR